MNTVRTQRGFTLIELVVVTGIMVVITSLVLANNNKFGGKVQLQNLAYDIALTVRQAQVYGISVQRFTTDTFAKGYGVHFIRNTDPSQRDIFTLFADALTLNGILDLPCPTPATPANCETVNSYQTQQGYHISGICVPKDSTPCDHSTLDITFRRPEPDAYIHVDSTMGSISPIYESARIVLTGPAGDTKSVVVEQNGQISVE